MPYRQLPKSDAQRTEAMQTAKDKADSTDPADWAISADTKARLDATYPTWQTEISERGAALAEQLEASKEEDAAQDFCALTCTHFIQVFNLGVKRGVFKASDRAYYGIDGNDENTPRINTEAEVTRWAKQLIQGEADRMAGGAAATPMSNPSAADIQDAYDDWQAKHTAQSTEKDEYDKEQEDVEGMRPDVDDLIRDIWDEVEFTYRKDDAPSKRRKAREWGVVYVTNPGEEPEEGGDLPAEG